MSTVTKSSKTVTKSKALSSRTQSDIKDFYDKPGKSIHLIVHLNHANSESAKSEFDALVAGKNPDSEIKC
jgi:hypothetical protein